MRYFVLATDYDGTLAEHGTVHPDTLKAMKRLRETGRHIFLVTGRDLPDLMSVFPEYENFELIVAENGALLYEPRTKAETPLAKAPPPTFANRLKEKGVHPLSVARVLIATLEDQKDTVLDTIHELGLELHMIFNKGSLMILPSGVNKATGLKCALEKRGLSLHNTVGIGDAENDHAFLSACERSVAVSNALPALKDESDLVTKGAAGRGVSELIGHLIENDLQDVSAKQDRDSILLGHAGEREVRAPYEATLLVAGPSGGGKSSFTTGIMERLNDAGYQFCVLDPEGDYQNFEGALILGDSKRCPGIDEIVGALQNPAQNLIVNLLGIHVDERPAFFETLMPRIQEMRVRTGRPHWLVLDEAHHLAPANREGSADALPKEWTSTMLITLEPDRLAQSVLSAMDTVIAVGGKPDQIIARFCKASDADCPRVTANDLKRGDALLWSRKKGGDPILFAVAPCRTKQARHSRKYSTAELTPDRSFYFRGPDGKLNLRAPNLATFVQLLQGVDDETWLFHLHRHEYSQWFRDNIKNKELADAAAAIEEQSELSADESRRKVKEEIEQRFTLPN